MKNALHLLTGFAFLALSASLSHPAQAQPAAMTTTAPTPASPECQSRALKLTCYYTDALRLNSTQAAAVRQATQQELQQLEQLDAAIVDSPETAKALPFTAPQVLAQYDAAMLNILTPGQYNAFHLLQERQPSLKLLNHLAQQ